MDSVESTSCVLLLNLPQRAFCGIDLLSFTASPKFLGVKNLPHGWHFVFTSPTNSFSIRHGAWFYITDSTAADPSRDVIVKKWDAAAEDFVAELDESELLRWRANLGSIWRGSLTPYRQSSTTASSTSEDGIVEEPHDWPLLTECLSSALMRRIFKSESESDWTLTSASSAAQDFDDIPGLSASESRMQREKELKLLNIDLKRTWREGAVGRERTNAAKDRSWALTHLIETQCETPTDIIGEMQLTFLMTLVLSNNSCFEQWKRIISLLLTCKQAAVEQSTFFVKFLGILKLQLKHNQDVEGGLFDMSDENGSLLKELLHRFRSGIEEMDGSMAKQDIIDALSELEDYLKDEYDWILNDPYVKSGMVDLEDGERVLMDMSIVEEEDEYIPTMVDADPELMREWKAQQGSESRSGQALTDDSNSPDGSGRRTIKDRINGRRMIDTRIEERIVETDSEEEDEQANQDIEDMDMRY